MTKCPYVPPHPWNVDFPHLMLRGKAYKFRHGAVTLRDRILTSTDRVGKLATIPVVVKMVNAANRSPPARAVMEKTLGVPRRRELPPYAEQPLRDRLAPSLRLAGAQRRAHAGQGGDLLHVLRQLQRAGHRPRPHRACSSTTASRTARREGGVLRHAEARARRFRQRREARRRSTSRVLAALARDGLRHPHAGAVVHAHVQAGAAAHVPRGRRRRRRARAHVRSVRVSGRARHGRPARPRLQAAARARSATTSPATAACRTSARRRARRSNGSPAPPSRPSSAAPATTARGA